MPEKISGTSFRPTEATGARRADAKPPGGTAAPKSGSATTGDTVHLTRSALLMGKLEEAVSAASGVDTARVQAVQDALASGSYEVDAEAVADAMLRSEQELGR